MRISLVEQMVMRYPRDMDGWRMYRIEYGGHGSDCNVEGTVWFPKWFDSAVFEEWYNAHVKEHT